MQFRLRDLLVLTMIVAGAFSLGLPVILAQREAARRTQCANNLKQFGLGIHNYHDTFKNVPPGGTGFHGAPRIGWQVRIIPFADQTSLYELLNFKIANVPQAKISLNIAPRGEPPIIKNYRHTGEIQQPYAMCPTDTRPSDWNDWAQTSYSGNLGAQKTASGNANCQVFDVAGVHYQIDRGQVLFGDTDDLDKVSGIFSRQLFGPVGFRDILDGTSNTFAVGEILADCHPNETGWWSDDGAGNAHASTAVPLNLMTTCAKSKQDARGLFMPECFEKRNTNFSWGFRSQHPRGANFAMCDGSVQFITEDIDFLIYQQYGSRSED
jgi:prepilin-type processing-associated H-X9-DG protein